MQPFAKQFLKEMQQKGVLVVTEHPKGVENVTSINYEHEIRGYKIISF